MMHPVRPNKEKIPMIAVVLTALLAIGNFLSTILIFFNLVHDVVTLTSTGYLLFAGPLGSGTAGV
jgi:hypothetical protein